MAAPQRYSSTCPPLLPVDHRPAMVPLPCEAAADPPPAAATNIIANKTALMSRSPRQGRDERRGQRREGAPRQRAVVRSEERRVGQEGVRTCRSRWVPDPQKTNRNKQ